MMFCLSVNEAYRSETFTAGTAEELRARAKTVFGRLNTTAQRRCFQGGTLELLVLADQEANAYRFVTSLPNLAASMLCDLDHNAERYLSIARKMVLVLV